MAVWHMCARCCCFLFWHMSCSSHKYTIGQSRVVSFFFFSNSFELLPLSLLLFLCSPSSSSPTLRIKYELFFMAVWLMCAVVVFFFCSDVSCSCCSSCSFISSLAPTLQCSKIIFQHCCWTWIYDRRHGKKRGERGRLWQWPAAHWWWSAARSDSE